MLTLYYRATNINTELALLFNTKQEWREIWRLIYQDLQLATGIAATTHWSINIALIIYYVIIN